LTAPKNAIVAFTFTERASEEMKFRIRERIGWVTITHVVVDEVQDLNPVQDRIVRAVVGDLGQGRVRSLLRPRD
jgi:ATP-dependent exoDNAse (exonuclease V) beta subunit